MTAVLEISLKHAKIAVIGLGYVGLPLAVEFGKKRSVVGYDVNLDRVAELRSGLDRTLECTRDELTAARHLSYSCDESDLSDCGVFIVTVPTPIDSTNRPDLRPLEGASEVIGRHLSVGDVAIYESTVFPGATEEVCVPILERVSGLKFNIDFFCGYSPERINPGDKVNTITTIKKVVSGSNEAVTEAMDYLYREIISAGTWRASSIRVAEASKVIENTQRDLNIAFVNELSVLFNRLGIDTMEVLEAAGTKWNFLPFRPGMVGGHCIGVDPYYLTYKAEQVGFLPQIMHAGRRVNEGMAKYAARSIIRMLAGSGVEITDSRVAVCGVTFKENCPDIRNSKTFELIAELQAWSIDVVIVDPWANKREVECETSVQIVDAVTDKSCDAVIFTVGHREFSGLTANDVVAMFKNPEKGVVGDLKSSFPKDEFQKFGLKVFRF
ncbi:MAG: nucleotide sugar dehydrogenase [Alphaproteobacteria bacterium]|nr:nucleotide sugar dehydrogenase [Alphaproteobacteria bacterium]